MLTKFQQAAMAALIDIAKKQSTLTTDDVWAKTQPLDDGSSRAAAMGAVITKARRENIIRRTEIFVHSARRSANHSRLIQVWDSLICETGVNKIGDTPHPSLAEIVRLQCRIKELEEENQKLRALCSDSQHVVVAGPRIDSRL